MNVLIAGSRSIPEHKAYLWLEITHGIPLIRSTIIIHGAAQGVDSAADRFADFYGLDKKVFPANWDKYGKAAGYIRNEQMIKECDRVFILWDGISKGTKHTIDLALKYKKPINIDFYTPEAV